VNDFKYWAFISYSHKDKAWGDWLHKALETYRVPKRLVGRASRDGAVPKRLFPVFRDRAELSASSDLGPDINASLKASRYLIVICSPESASSKWVNEEIKVFKTLGREDRILCLIVDGEPNASENPGSGLRECFPEAVRFRVDTSGMLTSQHTEPVAADARPDKDGRRNARLKVLAGLLDVGYDELKQREQQRQFRLMAGAASALLAIALTMSILAFFAVKQRNVAEANEREAVYQRGVALIEQGHALNMANRWLQGYTVLEQGRNILQQLGKPTLKADLRILEADLRTVVPYLYLNLPEVNGMDMSRDGSLLAVSNSRRVHIIDLEFDKTIASFDVDAEIAFLVLAPDGSSVAVAIGSELQIFDPHIGRLLHRASLQQSSIASSEFVPGTKAIIVAANDGGVHVWDTKTSKIEKVFDRDVELIAMDLSENGEVLAMAYSDGTTELCRFSNLHCSNRLQIRTGQLKSLVLSKDGKWLITADGKRLRVWDIESRSLLRESSASAHHLKLVGDVLFYTDFDDYSFSAYDIKNGFSLGSFISPRGVLVRPQVVFSVSRFALLTTTDDGVLYWQLTLDRPPGAGESFLLPDGETTNALSLSPNGLLTAIADSKGNVRVFDTYDLNELLTFRAHNGETKDISFAHRNDVIATVGTDGYAVVWELDSQKRALRYTIRGGKPTAVALDSNAVLLAVGTETGDVEVIDLETQTPVTAPLRLGNKISSLAFAPFGDQLAIASLGAEVHVWSRETQSVRKLAHFDFQGNPRVRFGSSGSLLVVAHRAFLFQSTIDLQSRPFGPAGGTIADAGFLGSDLLYLVYMFENRGVSILSIDTGQEVAYFSPRDTLPFFASASSNGDVLVIAGLDGIMSFASVFAINRMDLRRRMSSTNLNVGEESKGERTGLLAAWYLAHGLYTKAQHYLQATNLGDYPHSGLTMSRLWKATGQWDRAIKSLESSLERKEITPTYFALATRAIKARAAANPSSEGSKVPVRPR
jgi:WD40 repeat protein